jgi:hypothetical protein
LHGKSIAIRIFLSNVPANLASQNNVAENGEAIQEKCQRAEGFSEYSKVIRIPEKP